MKLMAVFKLDLPEKLQAKVIISFTMTKCMKRTGVAYVLRKNILTIFHFTEKKVLIILVFLRQMNCLMNCKTFLPLERGNLKLQTIS